MSPPLVAGTEVGGELGLEDEVSVEGAGSVGGAGADPNPDGDEEDVAELGLAEELELEAFPALGCGCCPCGNDTCGPMKCRCICPDGNNIVSCSHTCAGKLDSARAPRMKTRTWGLSAAASAVSGVPGLTWSVERSARERFGQYKFDS
jgi:hypothetical protein